MLRKQPSHIVKIYEALGCIGDSRVQLLPSGDGIISAQVFSSDRTKIYTVSYRQSEKFIISDYQNVFQNQEVDYPSLSLLLFLDVLDYQSSYGEALSGISWETINMNNSNDRTRIQSQIDEILSLQGIDIESLHNYCEMLIEKFEPLGLQYEDIMQTIVQ